MRGLAFALFMLSYRRTSLAIHDAEVLVALQR